MGDKKELTISERIKKEVTRLNGTYKTLSPEVKKVAKSLIENAAFMTITLEDLQNYINENGVITHYKNGENQYGTKKSPEVEIHISMTKNHSTVMKQLADLLPKTQPKVEDDGFEEFVHSRED